MLSILRRLINSRVGLIVSFVVLVLIALAFAGGDISSLRNQGLTASGDPVAARIGSHQITVADLKARTQEQMEQFRQNQPTLDIAQFIAGGGFEGTLERLINSLAFQEFAESQGMVVSRRAIDGQIASIPGLQGPDGKFSQATYERLLSQRHLTDSRIRADIIRDTLSQQLTAPTLGASQVPTQLALPYASLLLEKRTGQIGFIPTRSVGAGAPPTATDIKTYYDRNRARYTIPERRQIRYAIVAPAQFAATAVPSEAEIRAAYAKDAATYAASEKRSISQVVLADKAAADALAAKVKAGTAIDAAARADGLEAAKLTDLERKSYATQTAPDIAAAVFGAARGAVVGPLKAPLGWAVIRIDAVTPVAARSLDQVRGDIAKALTAEKTQAAMVALHDKIDDAIADNATFAELVSDNKLTPVTTPPVLADGRVIGDPAAPDPSRAEIIKAGFAAEPGDDPQLVGAGADGSFAVVALDKIVPAAPPPMAQLQQVLIRDFVIDRARRTARTLAAAAVAKINKGMSLADALAQTGLKLPAVQPMAASRAALAANEKGPPPPLVLLFSMAKGTAKLLEAPAEGGWFVIRLDTVDRGNAANQPQVITAMRSDLGKVMGREYVEEFAHAVRDKVGVKKNDAAIEQAKRDLAGQPAGPR